MHVKISTSNRRIQILIVRHVGDWRQVRVNRCRLAALLLSSVLIPRRGGSQGSFGELLGAVIFTSSFRALDSSILGNFTLSQHQVRHWQSLMRPQSRLPAACRALTTLSAQRCNESMYSQPSLVEAQTCFLQQLSGLVCTSLLCRVSRQRRILGWLAVPGSVSS